MWYRRAVTILGTIPYNAILLAIIFLTPYIYKGNRLHDAYILSLEQIPLAVKFGIIAGVSVCIGYILGVVIKALYYKPRPIPQPYKTAWQKIDASSFPSMHTAITTILAYYGIRTAFIFTYDVVEYILIGLWIVLLLCIAISRVKLKQHYRSDVIVGFIFGIMCIYVSRYLYSIIF